MTLKSLRRNTFIFIVWSLSYFFWLHWFLLTNWGFELFWAGHWHYIFQQWWYEGWVIKGAYFWVFFIALFLSIPFWILGFCLFASFDYKKWAERLFWTQIYQKKIKNLKKANSKMRTHKKKSYKEIRPIPLSNTVASMNMQTSQDYIFGEKQSLSKTDQFLADPPHFSHRELDERMEGNKKMDSLDNFNPFSENDAPSEDVDVLKDDFEPLNENLKEIMERSGCKVISDVDFDGATLDYVAVSDSKIFLVKKDDELGEWLADEERFNDEDPLWFSESAHRISPLILLAQKQKKLTSTLKKEGVTATVKSILVKTQGNIINAEDMLPIWEKMKMVVCRTGKGQPEELPSFQDAFPSKNKKLSESAFKKIRSILSK